MTPTGRSQTTSPVSIVLHPISPRAAAAVQDGRAPDDVRVAPDYPTEFSSGIAPQVGGGAPLGPYFQHRIGDDVVVGEIGGGFIGRGVVEIGHAVVASCRGQGYATDAVRELIVLAAQIPSYSGSSRMPRLTGRPAGRVLQKTGFTLVGQTEDEHEGVTLLVQRWELVL